MVEGVSHSYKNLIIAETWFIYSFIQQTFITYHMPATTFNTSQSRGRDGHKHITGPGSIHHNAGIAQSSRGGTFASAQAIPPKSSLETSKKCLNVRYLFPQKLIPTPKMEIKFYDLALPKVYSWTTSSEGGW